MPKHELVSRMKAYIQPFERRLALMELEAIAGAPPVPEPFVLGEPLVYRITTTQTVDALADALAYWEVVGLAATTGIRHTRQACREATTQVVRNGITPSQLRALLPFQGDSIPIPNRRVLRYGSHGAHEYRGKFFPQLVRALLNVAGIRRGDIVLDPMCGSGTTLIEASLLGCESIGLDLNPLSVFMSRAKCDVLRVPPDALAAEYESLQADLRQGKQPSDASSWFEHLPEKDRAYLASWFSPKSLADLDRIAVCIHSIRDAACRNLFRLCLSNILRRVSFQKDDDLRVRREKQSGGDPDVIAEFVNELSRTVRSVLAFLYQEGRFEPGPTCVMEGDARAPVAPGGPLCHLKNKVDAVVTSPPYATALPYLDTDRLSLCYLALLSRPHHRCRDYQMIGNREITENHRRGYWLDYYRHQTDLPEEIKTLIDRVHRLNNSTDVGFRRRNLPALLSRYFMDMRQVLQNIAILLKAGGTAFVIIGNNHTIAGGQHVDIQTDRLLGLIGQSVGLTLEQPVPMEMLVSRDIFKKNAVASETILCFRNGAGARHIRSTGIPIASMNRELDYDTALRMSGTLGAPVG